MIRKIMIVPSLIGMMLGAGFATGDSWAQTVRATPTQPQQAAAAPRQKIQNFNTGTTMRTSGQRHYGRDNDHDDGHNRGDDHGDDDGHGGDDHGSGEGGEGGGDDD